MTAKADPTGTRTLIARAFTLVEEFVYVGLGLLLSVSTVVLLGHAAFTGSRDLMHGEVPGAVIGLLDRTRLVLMVVELLYTVQVSFREHSVEPEPFLIVGLVAVTRRILVVTAEFSPLQERGESALRVSMIELGVLTLMIVALVVSLMMLRRRHPEAAATRA